MEKNNVVPIDAGWHALCELAAELEATHCAPFTKCFFEEHGEVIARVLRHLTDDPKSCQILKDKPC